MNMPISPRRDWRDCRIPPRPLATHGDAEGVVRDQRGQPVDLGRRLEIRLRQRFGIGRVYIVADRGMISAEAIAGLEERQLEYILGARERSDVLVKKIVMENDDSFVPLLIERQTGETHLFVKQVMLEDKRYVVCRNEAEAKNDRKDR
jgi:hypothetical protein